MFYNNWNKCYSCNFNSRKDYIPNNSEFKFDNAGEIFDYLYELLEKFDYKTWL